ncbi:hypothetical protein [Microbacterium sp. NPDC055683]
MRALDAVLRVFPKRWYVAHGDEVRGTFAEMLEDERRDRPTRAELADLAMRGVRMRVDDILPRVVRRPAASIAMGVLGGFAAFFLALHVVPVGMTPVENGGAPYLVGSWAVCGLSLLGALAAPISRAVSVGALLAALATMAAVAASRLDIVAVSTGPSTMYVALFALLAAVALLGEVTIGATMAAGVGTFVGLLTVHWSAGILHPRMGQQAFWNLVAGPHASFAALILAGIAVAYAAVRALRAAAVLGLLAVPAIGVAVLWLHREDPSMGAIAACGWGIAILLATVAAKLTRQRESRRIAVVNG